VDDEGKNHRASPQDTPDAGKRQRADFIVDSSQELDNACAQVRDKCAVPSRTDGETSVVESSLVKTPIPPRRR
jgi:hypothetical protein